MTATGSDRRHVLSPPTTPIRPRWHRRAVLGVLLLALLWGCRAPLLRTVPWLLITGDHDAPVEAFIMIDGGNSYDEIARRMASAPSAQVWLFDRMPNRLQRRGILPASRICSRHACETARIAADRMKEPATLISGTRHLLDVLDMELDRDQNLRIGLVVDEWNSRWLAGQVWSRIQRKSRDRVQIIPVVDPTHDRSTWWQTKPGRRRVAEAILKLTADWLIHDGGAPIRETSDEELRRAAVGPA